MLKKLQNFFIATKLFYLIPILSLIFINIIQIFFEKLYLEGDYFNIVQIIIFVSSLYLADMNRKAHREWTYIFLGIAIYYNPFLLFIYHNETIFFLNIIFVLLYLYNYSIQKNSSYYESNKQDINYDENSNKIKQKPKIIKNKIDISKPFTILGIGGGGSNIVIDLTAKYPDKYNSIAINSDKNALNKNTTTYKLYLNKDDGYGCGGKSECGFKLINEQYKTEIKKFTSNKNEVFIVSALGKGIGTGSTEAIATYLSSINKNVVMFLIFPFKWESSAKKRKNIHEMLMHIAYNKGIKIFLLHNNDLDKYYKNKSFKESFENMNNVINSIILNKEYQNYKGVMNVNIASIGKTIHNIENLSLYIQEKDKTS